MDPLNAAAAGISYASDQFAATASNVVAGSADPALAVQSELQVTANIQADAAIIATEQTILGIIVDLKI